MNRAIANRASTRRHGSDLPANRLARGLGWFSIGLGLAEMLAPHAMARALGMRGSENLLRAYGLREIGTGIGILSSREPSGWMWGRVGGDALDLATLAAGTRNNPRKENVAFAMAAVAGVTVLDVVCAQELDRQERTRRMFVREYARRSGLPRPPRAMRGAARDFEVPADMRIPEAMRPYTTG